MNPFRLVSCSSFSGNLMEGKGGQDPFNLEFSRVSSAFPFPSLFASFRPIQQLADLAGRALWSSLVAFCLLGRFKSPAEEEEEKETVLFSVSISTRIYILTD